MLEDITNQDLFNAKEELENSLEEVKLEIERRAKKGILID